MGALHTLDTILQTLRTYGIAIGGTVAGLMIAVYATGIMLDNDTSPAARALRWERLKRCIICAIIIAAATAIAANAASVGKMFFM